MIQLDLTTPLGIPVHDHEFDQAFHELQRTGRFDQLDTTAIRAALESLRRDAIIQAASGRWQPGRPDPDQFVPGDIAAIRAMVCDGLLRDILTATLVHDLPGPGQAIDGLQDRLLEQPVLASMLTDIATAVPYYIPTTAAAAVLASHPPHPELQADLRLPFQKILVLFGADLELDPASYPWPGRFPFHELSSFGIVSDLIRRGGYLSGMVLLADHHGRLHDDVVWIVAANPNPQLPWPASLDRIRGPVRGWRAAADLGPLVDNVAAAIAWAPWHQPPPPPSIPEPTSRSLRKALKRNAIRVRERHGALVGVRVLDLGRSLAHAGQTDPAADPDRQRASPIPHLRSGHFRRVRVGPRASFHYEVRWIPPVWVQGDTDRAAQRLVVRRIPPPTTWTQPPAQQLADTSEQGRPVPAHLEEPPRPLPRHPVTDHDPFGIDLP